MLFGTFYVLHPGHEYVFKQARRYGDYLIVIIARDVTVLNIKKHCPQNSERKRASNLRKTGCAEKVILGNVGDKMKVVKTENPDVIALGYDQNNFIKELTTTFPKIKIKRLKSYYPKKYKSSLMTVYAKNKTTNCHYK